MLKTYITQADILNQRRVDLGLVYDLLQQRVEYVIQLCVLESTLDSLSQRSTQSKRNDYIVWIFLGAAQVSLLLPCDADSNLHGGNTSVSSLEVAENRIQTICGHGVFYVSIQTGLAIPQLDIRCRSSDQSNTGSAKSLCSSGMDLCGEGRSRPLHL